MKINFVRLTMTAILFVGLNSVAAETNKSIKPARKAASKVSCVELDKPFDGIEQYTLEESESLRNSIFAQYGYKFTNPKIAAEMKSRGCLKEEVTYKYANLTETDKTNVKAFKAYEQTLKNNSEDDFVSSWKKSATKPKERQALLQNAYCVVKKSDEYGDTYLGLLQFGDQANKDQKFKLSGLFDLTNAKYINAEGNSVALDSTSLAYFDSTSAMSVELKSHGTWFVDKSGNVVASINPVTKAGSSVKLEIGTEDFKTTNMLSCKVAKH